MSDGEILVAVSVEVVNFMKHNDKKTSQWFKLQNDWFDDPKLAKLAPTDRYLFLVLCGLRASNGGPLENIDVTWLQRRCNLQGRSIKPSLLNLCKQGLISLDKIRLDKKREEREGGSAAAAPRPSAATPPPPPDLIHIWNSNCGKLPKCAAMNKARKARWRARWQESPDPHYWVDVVQRLSKSGFANGDNDRGWRASIDFLLQSETHLKIIEGKYDNHGGGGAGVIDWGKVFE